MYLKRLEIQGFKTFASRTVLEFRPGVSAVVGPNGSGKSNIADAVRWVLGEQSFSVLRCKRTEELLFSGGGKRAPAGLVEVSLTIDNSDRLLPLEFDEVTLTRRATRAGDNEYFINRVRVRLRDVNAATEPLGGSYTIINQGLVDAALTLNPEDRRRLFEDAAEIGGFETRKNEAERRLRETDTNLQRLQDVLGELEPRLRSLKRQATQARQYHEINTELRGLQATYYTQLWHAAQRHAAATTAHAAHTESQLSAARTAQQRVGDELRALRTALREQRDHLGALHQQSSALHRRAEQLQRDLAVGNERLAALTRRTEDSERNRRDLAQRHEEAEHERSTAAQARAAAEAAVAAQRHEEAAYQHEIANSETTRRTLEREARAAGDAALSAATRIAEVTSRSEQLTAQHERLTQEKAELAATLRQHQERVATLAQQVDAAQTALAATDAQIAAAAHAENATRAQLEALRNERSAADETRAAARRTLVDAEARLESLNRLARSYAGTFAGVKTAMQWAERTGRNGFALLAAIIRTPAEIETAVEVALGSRLQNIVVETWRDAEDAITELKRTGAGRATFLPLDTLRTTRREAKLPTPDPQSGVFGVAAELVDYDAHYADVVWQVLGRTLVVRDLATARQELRRRAGGWTIVTLEGEQVNTGGAVTGGARTKESGTLRRERELRELPQQVAAAQALVEQTEQQRRVLDEQTTAQTQQLRQHEAASRDAQRQRDQHSVALDATQRRRAQAEQEHTWSNQRGTQIERDLAALAAQTATLATQHSSAAHEAASAQQRLADLQAQQETTGTASQAAQEQLATIRAAVARAEADLNTQQTLVRTHAQALQRIAQQRDEIERNATALAAERDQRRAAHDQNEATHRALLAEIDTLRSQIEPIERELHASETHQASLEQHETDATAALLAHEAAHNRATLEAQRAQDRLETIFERAVADNVDLPDEDADHGDVAEPSPDLHAQIEALKTKILRLGTVNPLALEEYDETAERQEFLRTQIADLRQAKATLSELIGELDETMHSRFADTFKAVASEFEHRFTRLFGGGVGHLHLTGNGANGDGNNHDTLEATNGRGYGVEILARPPGKRQQNISLLSGGERALTASALLFAILTVNPSPFCILDEVDAALDESNVGRFRDALGDLTATTQFILITHNRGTIEAADTLYGVTMGDDGASKVLSLRVEEYQANKA